MVSRDEAIEQMRRIAAEYHHSCPVYLSKMLLTCSIRAEARDEEVFPANPQGYWLGFVDREPIAAWGHDVIDNCVAWVTSVD